MPCSPANASTALALVAPQMTGSSSSPVSEAVVLRVAVAQHVVDAEEPGHRVHLVLGRRRREHHRVPAIAVGGDELPSLGVDEIADASLEHPITHGLQVVVPAPLPRSRADAQHVLEAGPLHGRPSSHRDRAGDLREADIPRAEALRRQVHGGVAGDQRPVEVEEGTDRRAPPHCARISSSASSSSRASVTTSRHVELEVQLSGRAGCRSARTRSGGRRAARAAARRSGCRPCGRGCARR